MCQMLFTQHLYERDVQNVCLILPNSQIREKLKQLQEKREKIDKKWQDKMDHLQIGKGA